MHRTQSASKSGASGIQSSQPDSESNIMHRTQLPSKSDASGIQSSSKSVRVTGTFCHPSESSRRRNSVVIQIRCQSPAHSTPHDPSESSRHRIPFRVRTAVYHASVNSSHPILPGHSWRPSLSRRHPSAWPAPSRVQVQPIRIHPSAWPACRRSAAHPQ